jgi:hypothetical protein
MVLDNCGGHLWTQQSIGFIFKKAGDDGHFFASSGFHFENGKRKIAKTDHSFEICIKDIIRVEGKIQEL